MLAGAKAIALGVALLGLLVVALTVGGGQDCAQSAQGSGSDGSLTTAGAGGDRAIPTDMRRAYVKVAGESGVPAAILAAVGYVETRHGRIRATSSAGAQGPMQFLPSTWRWLRCPGTITNVDDAVSCASTYLKMLGKEPGSSGDRWQYAMCRYNGGCRPGVPAEAGYGSTGQVAFSIARSYGYQPGKNNVLDAQTVSVVSDEACGDEIDQSAGVTGQTGPVRWLPTANRPGVPVTAALRRYLALLAGQYGSPITVCFGTNHGKLTSSGNVSEHWAGNGADICSSANQFPIATYRNPSSGGAGNRIAEAAFLVAGVSPTRARSLSRLGGLCNVTTGRQRVQIIWKTSTGGNHYHHIHIGLATQTGAAGIACQAPAA